MGLTPSRGGLLPAPRTHLSSRIRSHDQPGAADKMAGAAFSSGPHRNNTSARPPDRTWSLSESRPQIEETTSKEIDVVNLKAEYEGLVKGTLDLDFENIYSEAEHMFLIREAAK
ncbi:hypothetical protein NDU88_005803 [Pleurodeles waltl]|uniref:Uncharacterized protein n=1 Tax=Pleurodeles waltl TaxID=8319 RepID=A0AAV7RJP1_PLEWA|nr:hypothetical protein NDU88_005803 [Pleurodeles waltl]